MDLMIDIETLDTKNSAVVAQIGWCVFDHKAIITYSSRVMAIQEQLDMGRTISESTLMWWMGQPEEARKRVFLFHSKFSLSGVKEDLQDVIREREVDRVWAHGPHFDLAIMKDFMGDGLFHYRSPRDTRTLADLSPQSVKPEPTVKHDAGEDALAQAKWVQNIWRDIGWPHGWGK